MLSTIFWPVFSLSLYFFLNKFLNDNCKKYIPPLLLASIVIIMMLKFLKIDFATYNQGSKFITYLLTPATIALGYPLAKHADVLTQNKRATYFGLLFTIIFGFFMTIFISKIFHTDFNVLLSLLPRSVTTPIAMEISKSIGAIMQISICTVIFTGITGAILGKLLLTKMKIEDETAVALSIGATSHIMGTSTLSENHKQVAISTVSLILVAILTAIFAPLVVQILKCHF